jgi:nicotinate-nucleotide adenylyltransferase
MRLGYFGGSFDPPHLGHLAVADAAARAFSLGRVLFVPTGRQPLKPVGASAPFPDRLAMTQLLCDSQPAAKFEVSTLDAPLANGEPNYTVDALDRLHRQSPADEIFALVGADAFLELRRWRDPDRLLALAEWIVVSRPGFALHEMDALGLSAAQRLRVHALGGVAEPASARRIREDLRMRSDCAELLPPSVLAYIRAHHLYGT